MAVSYTRAKAKDLNMGESKMVTSAFSTSKLCAGKMDKQRTIAGLVVHSVDESGSSAEKENFPNTKVGNIYCLSASLVSRSDAKLFWLIKAPSGLGF